VLGKVVEPAWSGNDDGGVLGWIFEVVLVFLQGDSSEVAAELDFWLFEVASCVLGCVPSRLKSLKIW
jgi:hypothetical protein